MTSISTISRRLSSVSPPLGPQLVSSYNLDSIEPLFIRDEQEQLPSISSATKNLLIRHTQELRENIDPLIPRVGNSGRKAFREFFMKEAVTIFDFLDKPFGDNKVLFQSHNILKKFGKGDYTGNKNKLRDLILDIDCSESLQEIQQQLRICQVNSETPFTEWVQNTRTIIDQWKKATSDFSLAEAQLQIKMTLFDDITKRVQTVMHLPSSEGYEELLRATEVYLKNIFEDNNIEEIYNDTIKHLKKIVILTDAMAIIRQIVNVSTEPLCSICFQEVVSLVSIPCGHTFCISCGGKQLTNCYICRIPVKDRVKIYFS